MISFVLFPQASQPSMNFNISELVNYLQRWGRKGYNYSDLRLKAEMKRFIAAVLDTWAVDCFSPQGIQDIIISYSIFKKKITCDRTANNPIVTSFFVSLSWYIAW